ncbi:MAG: tRNA lysidine(34) synthetase TilS [Myxococcota bacterium]
MVLPQLRRTLTDRALVARGDHVLVACSGGPDSIALLHALHCVREQFGVTLAAASIDHGLRAESADEVALVEATASALGVPFSSTRLSLSSEGGSLQARARAERYAALADLAEEAGANLIAAGHTQDDQAETVLMRMLRGSGLRGLRGVNPARDDGIIRPLIDCPRDAVRAYAVSMGLQFVDDPSNEARAFERVRIRREVLPVLLAEDPQIVGHLAAIADEAAELETWLEGEVPDLPERGDRAIDVESLATMPSPVRSRWLRRWLLRETGSVPGRTHLRDVGRLLTGAGEVLLGSGWAVRRGGGRLCLEYRENRPTRSSRS